MQYGSNEVLHDVTFAVRRGEVLALLGPNGAGKTTTIEILEGFRRRSAGTVTVLGVDPAQGDEAWRARIGVVLQSWRDHAKWKVRDLLVNHGSLYRPYASAAIPRPRDVDEVLAAVGLTDKAASKVGQLSGGQRRRLDVAIGIIGNPEVLFLDEPTTGFDPEARREFHSLVQDLAKSGNTTILLTTHDLAEAEKLSDRIIILAKGRVRADGSVAELAGTVTAKTTVTWRKGSETFTDETSEPIPYLRRLFDSSDDIEIISVYRPSLEDTYLSIVRTDDFRASNPHAETPAQVAAEAQR
ncbi:ABC transporter ATP-binding protein [Micromonospora sp. WMMD735]|uniref:ABC transporter ATP-binding protein n=1 Tax=Micromonospora sp. WMMD735 TaxID=3404130 RepID=UPI003B931EFC